MHDVWWAVLSIILFFGSILAVGYVVLQLPVDHFENQLTGKSSFGHESWPLFVLRNLLGVVLIILGIIMLFTPGQGVLTILLGVLLVEFPGKHRVMKKILKRPQVLAGANRFRARFGKPPFQVSHETAP